MVGRVEVLLEKGRLQNVIFYVQISQIEASEDTATETSTLGVLYSAFIHVWQSQYITTWAISSCLS